MPVPVLVPVPVPVPVPVLPVLLPPLLVEPVQAHLTTSQPLNKGPQRDPHSRVGTHDPEGDGEGDSDRDELGLAVMLGSTTDGEGDDEGGDEGEDEGGWKLMITLLRMLIVNGSGKSEVQPVGNSSVREITMEDLL